MTIDKLLELTTIERCVYLKKIKPSCRLTSTELAVQSGHSLPLVYQVWNGISRNETILSLIIQNSDHDDTN